MNIIIVGAARIGRELAQYLVSMGHAVTMIDEPSAELSTLSDRLDLRVVQGDALSPAVLRRAGAENTELLVAVTSADEFNIAVCALGYALFAIPRKIARIRTPDLLAEAPALFNGQALPIDHVIAPEHITAADILDLIELPGCSCCGLFADERVVVGTAVCRRGGKLLGAQVAALESDSKARVVGLYRQHEPIRNFMHETLTQGDEIFFCVERSRALAFLSALGPLDAGSKIIAIAGGTHAADELARNLSLRYRVKLIEPDPQRAQRLQTRFHSNNVELFYADPCDPDFIHEEHLYDCDRFIAASPSDEINVIAGQLLKRYGCPRTLAVISKTTLSDLSSLLGSADVDVLFEPREAVISTMLSDIYQDGVIKLRLFNSGRSCAAEILVQEGSRRVVGHKISDITWPNGVNLGLVLRGRKLLPCTPDLEFASGDRLIAYLNDQAQLRRLSELLRPRVSWIPKVRLWS